MNLVIRISILLFSIALFASGIALAFNDKTASASVVMAAGVITLIFLYLSQFKRFKGLGIEAELWEQEMEEAEQLVSRLQGLSVAVSEPLMYMAARSGRWSSGIPRRKKFEMMKGIEAQLRDNGVPEQKIIAAMEEWHRFNLIDLSMDFRQAISDIAHEKIREIDQMTKQLSKPISGGDIKKVKEHQRRHQEIDAQREAFVNVDLGAPNKGYSGRLENNFESIDFLDGEEKESLKRRFAEDISDVEYYEENKKFRRLEHWFTSEEN